MTLGLDPAAVLEWPDTLRLAVITVHNDRTGALDGEEAYAALAALPGVTQTAPPPCTA